VKKGVLALLGQIKLKKAEPAGFQFHHQFKIRFTPTNPVSALSPGHVQDNTLVTQRSTLIDGLHYKHDDSV